MLWPQLRVQRFMLANTSENSLQGMQALFSLLYYITLNHMVIHKKLCNLLIQLILCNHAFNKANFVNHTTFISCKSLILEILLADVTLIQVRGIIIIHFSTGTSSAIPHLSSLFPKLKAPDTETWLYCGATERNAVHLLAKVNKFMVKETEGVICLMKRVRDLEKSGMICEDR